MDSFLELVLKQPKDKPPFIGILFQSEFKAAKLNQEWIESAKTHKHQITLEPNGELLELTLTQKELHHKYTYKISKFEPDKLKRFLFQVKDAEQINFGHITLKEDQHIPVRISINRALWVLPVDKIEFNEEY